MSVKEIDLDTESVPTDVQIGKKRPRARVDHDEVQEMAEERSHPRRRVDLETSAPETHSVTVSNDYVPFSPTEEMEVVRLYADGIFDMFHFGHARVFEQCKKLWPEWRARGGKIVLLVGCCSDALTHSMKGRTVMNEDERYESLRHCRWVDEVIRDAPWTLNDDFLRRHNVHAVAHDDAPYASDDADDVYAFVKRTGRFVPTQRTEGISTSDIITRIVRDYDDFVKRNLRRGIPHHELGVSAWRANRIALEDGVKRKLQRAEEKYDEFVDRVRQWMDERGNAFDEFTSTFSARMRRGTRRWRANLRNLAAASSSQSVVMLSDGSTDHSSEQSSSEQPN
ncbi:MAG: hypothetical protein MHM6MM_001938 [Cercozoa sp. M6MM]